MYNLAEYIMIARTAHIIKNMTSGKNYDCKTTYLKVETGNQADLRGSKNLMNSNFLDAEQAVAFQRAVEDMFLLLFEGCDIRKFVVCNTECPDQEYLPILLVEIFEPYHLYVPVYITNGSILIISPFPNKFIEKFSQNPYVCELTDTLIFKDYVFDQNTNGDISRIDSFLFGINREGYENNPEYKHIQRGNFVKELIEHAYGPGIVQKDKLITESFRNIYNFNFKPVFKNDIEWTKMEKVFSLETMDALATDKYDDPVIDVTDFIPISIEYNGSSGYSSCDEIEQDGKVITRIGITNYSMSSQVTPQTKTVILVKENRIFGKNVIIALNELYYVGNNEVAIVIDGNIIDIQKLTDTYELPDNGPFSDIAQEGLSDMAKKAGGLAGETLKAFYYIVTKFNLKVGTPIWSMLINIFKKSGSHVKWVFNQFKKTFMRGIELEKAETLELREKLLNDEIDEMSQRITFWAQTWFMAIPLAAALGGVIWFLPSWLFSRSRNKKSKVKALERLERQLDDAIERLERKVNYAEERSENESVDSLLRELQMYKAAKSRLLTLKKEAYGKKPIKYATFDKDLTLTAQQRIDKYISGNNEYD